jgi:hypothetical protein
MSVQPLPTPQLRASSLETGYGARDAAASSRPTSRRPGIEPRHRWLQLSQRFADSGGMVSSSAFTAMLRGRCDQPLSVLARWIVDRHVLSFEACGERWLPLFQFEPGAWRVRSGVELAVGELRGVFDDDELVDWFATPNAWLSDRSPASLVATHATAVLEAARADRFVAAG